jgi:hypothetical protein
MSIEIKWQRVSLVSRLVCGLFGLCGVFIASLLLNDLALLEKQTATILFELFLGAVGFLIFLLVAIVGRFPSFATDENHGESKS